MSDSAGLGILPSSCIDCAPLILTVECIIVLMVLSGVSTDREVHHFEGNLTKNWCTSNITSSQSTSSPHKGISLITFHKHFITKSICRSEQLSVAMHSVMSLIRALEITNSNKMFQLNLQKTVTISQQCDPIGR